LPNCRPCTNADNDRARYEHVAAFAEILTGRYRERLDAWIAEVTSDDQPDLHSFTAELRRHHRAVRKGLTLPHDSGAVEAPHQPHQDAQTPDIRRACLDLLCKRVLPTQGQHTL
jgi:hypothetical protein